MVFLSRLIIEIIFLPSELAQEKLKVPLLNVPDFITCVEHLLYWIEIYSFDCISYFFFSFSRQLLLFDEFAPAQQAVISSWMGKDSIEIKITVDIRRYEAIVTWKEFAYFDFR